MHAARAKGRPYTIVFVGVNGVGKSTNLAKICYWLLQNDVKVHRAGALHCQVSGDHTLADSESAGDKVHRGRLLDAALMLNVRVHAQQ